MKAPFNTATLAGLDCRREMISGGLGGGSCHADNYKLRGDGRGRLPILFSLFRAPTRPLFPTLFERTRERANEQTCLKNVPQTNRLGAAAEAGAVAGIALRSLSIRVTVLGLIGNSRLGAAFHPLPRGRVTQPLISAL